jgi:serine/threonine-protein phosphatase 4 regulatory subunit 1
LSASLHEIARILGPEITNEDLLPIADRFLKHSNADVRMASLKNLHIFLAEVQDDTRNQYIRFVLQAFNEAGNDWRTKEMIAKNLGNFATLFDKKIVKEEFLPMFFKCCEDRVSRVSEPAASALAPILIKFSEERDQQKAIIKIVKNNFRHGQKVSFKRRQLYILMCEELMNQSKDLFDEYFKHDMLSLVADKVVNVRITLARALKNHFRKINCTLMNDALVNQAIRVLRQDRSQDVLHLIQEL